MEWEHSSSLAELYDVMNAFDDADELTLCSDKPTRRLRSLVRGASRAVAVSPQSTLSIMGLCV